MNNEMISKVTAERLVKTYHGFTEAMKANDSTFICIFGETLYTLQNETGIGFYDPELILAAVENGKLDLEETEELNK